MKWCVASPKASLLSALILGVSGCGATASPSRAAEANERGPGGAQEPALTPRASSSDTPDSESAPSTTETADAGAAPPTAPPDAREQRALPRVVVQNIGLHIGGGPNDPDTKSPFQNAIERRFPDLLRCYRFVEEPAKGGTFGVDLYIAREGGNPSVRQPRTAMGGSEFRKCVVVAFERVKFERPKLGPTVISYSIRFEIE